MKTYRYRWATFQFQDQRKQSHIYSREHFKKPTPKGFKWLVLMCCFQQILSEIYPHPHRSQDDRITRRRLCRKIKYSPRYFTVEGGHTHTGMHYHKRLCPPYINIQLPAHQHSVEQDIKLSQAEEPPPSTSSVGLPWNKRQTNGLVPSHTCLAQVARQRRSRRTDTQHPLQ